MPRLGRGYPTQPKRSNFFISNGNSQAVLQGSGALFAAGSINGSGVAVLGAVGSLVAVGTTGDVPGVALLGGVGTLTAKGVVRALLTGSGTLSASATKVSLAEVDFLGVGTFLSSADPVTGARALFGGYGGLAATGRLPGAVVTSGVTPPPRTHTIRLVDRFGNIKAELDKANCKNWAKELRNLGSTSFTIPVRDPKCQMIDMENHEIQVWRNGLLKMWGTPLRFDSDGRIRTYQCLECHWILGKRRVGRGARTNHFVNPSFEDSPVGSFPVGWDSSGIKVGTTVTTSSNEFFSGSRACYGVSVEKGLSSYIKQVRTITATTHPIEVHISARHKIDIPGWIGPAYSDRGLYVRVTNGAGDVMLEAGQPIDNRARRGGWVKDSGTVVIPSGQTWTIEVRLHFPGGGISWDSCWWTTSDGLYFDDVDQASIFGSLVAHAQDPAYGKTDMNIGVAPVATGVTRDMAYLFENRQPILAALDEFAGLHNGLEYEMTYTAANRILVPHSPRIARRTGVRLSWPRNIRRYTLPTDRTAMATDITLRCGDEEGGSSDSSVAVSMEEEFSVPGDVASQDLKPLSSDYLTALGSPQQALTCVVSGDMLEQVKVGDVLETIIDNAADQVSGDWRVVRIDCDCETDEGTLTMNPDGPLPYLPPTQEQELIDSILKEDEGKQEDPADVPGPGTDPDSGSSPQTNEVVGEWFITFSKPGPMVEGSSGQSGRFPLPRSGRLVEVTSTLVNGPVGAYTEATLYYNDDVAIASFFATGVTEDQYSVDLEFSEGGYLHYVITEEDEDATDFVSVLRMRS